jgi:predicted ATPase/DNA-binding XRE family transcriptional regulator
VPKGIPFVTQKAGVKTFGRWLRQYRRELDLTQQALADQVGCARVTLRRIESQTLKPSKELAELLLKELGIQNSELAAWIRFARGLADYPSLNPSPPRTNLPFQLTSFIGREKEMDEIKDALFKYRLVTLTGSGGTGKSRLSLQVAADLLDAFPDGLWFIELAPLRDPRLVPQTIWNAIGLVEQKDITILQALQEYLREKKVLFVLDNCEHLIETCAELSNDLLSHTANLKILASSREALGVQGEFSWRVPSLALPNMNNIPEVEQISQYEAVRLFIERAQLINPKFEVNKFNAPAIAQICYRLGGIPLAIELAAAKLRTLSVEQIRVRLDDRFNLLINGARTVLPRHQTLRAMIDWSYNLLSENEKILFRRLAVFIGGWSLEAAESICAGGEIMKADIIDLILGLVQKSLIYTEELPDGIRYRRLETIRQYGQEKLSAIDDVENIRNRHLRYYVELLENAESELRSSNQLMWFNRLEMEMDNLRSALGWARKRDKEAFLRLSSSLWWFFRTLEHKNEGIDWLSKAVADNNDTPTELLSTATARLSYLSLYVSETQEHVDEYATAALELSRQLNDPFSEALALTSLAELELNRLTIEFGPQHLRLALEIAQKLQDHWLISTVLLQKGRFDQLKNPIEGMMVFEEGLREAQLAGDKRLVCLSLLWMLPNLLATCKFTRAKEVAQQYLTVATEIDDKDGIIFSHNALGSISLYEENYLSSKEHAKTVSQLARSYHHESGLLHSLGTAGLVNLALNNLPQVLELAGEMEKLIRSRGRHFKADVGYHVFLRAWAYILAGDMEGIRKNAKELVDIYRQENNILIYIEYLRVFASLGFICGDHYKNVALTSFVKKLRERVVLSYFDYPFMIRYREEQLAESRTALGEEAFTKAEEGGRVMEAEEAIHYALEVLNA